MLKQAITGGCTLYRKNFKALVGGFAIYLVALNLVSIIFEVTIYSLLPVLSAVLSAIFLAPLEIGIIKFLFSIDSQENDMGAVLYPYSNAKSFLRSTALAVFVTGSAVAVKIISDYFQAVINAQSTATLTHSIFYISAYIVNILLSVAFFACYYIFAKYEHQNIFKTLVEGVKKSLRHFFSIAVIQILAFAVLTGISAFSFWLVGEVFGSILGENIILLGRLNTLLIMLIQLAVLPLLYCIRLKLAEQIIE